MIYLDLLWGFLKVGLFSFGGAYGAIPLIRDVVLSYGWLSDAELSNMIAISESTPGPIMINLATYVGSSQAGLPGALLATFAVALPAFLIILLLMGCLKTFWGHRSVQAVLFGLRPCIIGIILATGIYMMITNVILTAAGFTFNWRAALMTVILSALMFGSKRVCKKQISPIALIVIAGILGVCLA